MFIYARGTKHGENIASEYITRDSGGELNDEALWVWSQSSSQVVREIIIFCLLQRVGRLWNSQRLNFDYGDHILLPYWPGELAS